MSNVTIDKQSEFEKNVANILGFKNIKQRKVTEQMIISDFGGGLDLSGSVCWKRGDHGTEYLLIATKDSEVNYIESISPEMINEIVRTYTIFDKEGLPKPRITLATNIPIDIHSSKAKDLRTNSYFHIERIGYSFCEKHGLEYVEIY